MIRFNPFYINKELFHTVNNVDDLDNLYQQNNDYLDSIHRYTRSPAEFVKDIYSCEEKYKQLIIQFLEQYYEPEEVIPMLGDITFFTLTPIQKYISRFRVPKDGDYSAVIEECMFENDIGVSCKRYYVSLYSINGQSKSCCMNNEHGDDFNRCVALIRRNIGSRMEYSIKWLKAD